MSTFQYGLFRLTNAVDYLRDKPGIFRRYCTTVPLAKDDISQFQFKELTSALFQALKSSFQISEEMKGVPVSGDCLKAVQKMNSCPACQGFPGLRPCNHYCVDVMKGCLSHQIMTQDLWDKFIGES